MSATAWSGEALAPSSGRDPVSRCFPLGRQAVFCSQAAAVSALLAAGASLEARDSLGRTPLHVAAEASPEAARALLGAAGAAALLAARDRQGRTPLDAALEADKPDVVQLLLEAAEAVPNGAASAGVGATLHHAVLWCSATCKLRMACIPWPAAPPLELGLLPPACLPAAVAAPGNLLPALPALGLTGQAAAAPGKCRAD